MTTDKLASGVGIVLGALHQVGVVGRVPQTRAEWLQTGLSVGFILLGYVTNKTPQAPPAAPVP
jgi:hypothetical protein